MENEKPPTSLIASVTPSNRSRVVVDQPVRAELAARLLVGEEAQHDVARRAPALAPPLAHDREDHRVHVLHVDRAASPDDSRRRSRRRTGRGSSRVASAGTTSRWPCTSSAGRLGSSPSHRATRLVRPVRGLERSPARDRPRRACRRRTRRPPAPPARCRRRSCDESIRIRSRQRSTTSSSASVRRAGRLGHGPSCGVRRRGSGVFRCRPSCPTGPAGSPDERGGLAGFAKVACALGRGRTWSGARRTAAQHLVRVAELADALA